MTSQSASILHLSRFFFAATASDLREAYAGLSDSGTVPLPLVEDWAEVAFCFNRLFVGPRALVAPPYATVYSDGDDTRLMGASTGKIRSLYAMLGLISPWQNKIPDDHIAFELDALWQIEQALQTVASPQLQDARDYLRSHLQTWVPAFVRRIETAPALHPAILAVTGALIQALRATDEVGSY